MSVVIKNMDKKPTDCIICRLLDGGEDCFLQDARFHSWDEQIANCPLGDVPDINDGKIETRLSQELYAKSCVITDSEGKDHEVIHYGDLKDVIRKVLGWWM